METKIERGGELPRYSVRTFLLYEFARKKGIVSEKETLQDFINEAIEYSSGKWNFVTDGSDISDAAVSFMMKYNYGIEIGVEKCDPKNRKSSDPYSQR